MEALTTVSVPFDHRPDREGAFRSWVRRRHYDSAIFAEMRLDACTSERVNIGRLASEEYVCITIETSGRHRFSQGNCEFAVEPGDVFIWCAQNKCKSISREAFAGRTLMVPRALAERRIGNIGDLYGRRAAHGQGVTHLAFSHLMNLHDNVQNLPDENVGEVVAATLELLRCCLPQEQHEIYGSKYAKDVFARCMAFVRLNLADPDFSLIEVANHLGISTRSVQQLFTRAGTTYSAFVRKERLTQAAQALSSDAFGRVSITEVAYRFGFYDLAHFSRNFKAEFGAPPNEYRRRYCS